MIGLLSIGMQLYILADTPKGERPYVYIDCQIKSQSMINVFLYFLEISEKHGPVMLLHLCSKPVFVALSVEDARAIMKTHDVICTSRPKYSITEDSFMAQRTCHLVPIGSTGEKLEVPPCFTFSTTKDSNLIVM
ncbi:hypothetical protein H5410_061710 [Solanum commersonii]|uniref:Uncharacterized protein n=1 Tax=Solanum commersonii TaxID=4109 RepID=A0A9J5WA08_SOLCO|nr:hypothetical protein H5410_061710 [Solanum commersonii]